MQFLACLNRNTRSRTGFMPLQNTRPEGKNIDRIARHSKYKRQVCQPACKC